MGFFRDISTCCVVKLVLIVNSHKEPQERALYTEECRNDPFQHDLRNLLFNSARMRKGKYRETERESMKVTIIKSPGRFYLAPWWQE